MQEPGPATERAVALDNLRQLRGHLDLDSAAVARRGMRGFHVRHPFDHARMLACRIRKPAVGVTGKIPHPRRHGSGTWFRG